MAPTSLERLGAMVVIISGCGVRSAFAYAPDNIRWHSSRMIRLQMSEASSPVLDATRSWVDRFVIGLGLCPWARPVAEAGRIRYVLTETHNGEGLFDALLSELRELSSQPESIETTFLVHPHALNSWVDYVGWLQGVEQIFEQQGVDDTYQLVGFHPDFVFGGTVVNDASNWVNRSPYPMIHILRQASVTRAVTDLPEIPIGLNNKRLLQSMAGDGELQTYLSVLPGMRHHAIEKMCVHTSKEHDSVDAENQEYLYLDDTGS
eukprot:CAMPEP_0183354448 /NCGR_PEP_ID=MMETSP0164_2-20130417/37317_1 /TAXON_ID=221442 /ORGANISM="Coccolithus pelagicus ssp braarudi, Strain PLY182g" /LENGTH=261 /DNA_ID=CAMNT_0025527329 /DNA_START=13 /DNA_END=798 /DNA_ORIENTATION=+